jgi:hypothetical protein
MNADKVKMTMQIIPLSGPLLASMPSGREYHTPQEYILPELSEDVLAKMRAPPDPGDLSLYKDDNDDSGSEEEQPDPVGAFPGTGSEYPTSKTPYF